MVALRRLGNHLAWPMSPFQLECEVAGVYQNVSGKALKELREEGEIKKRTVSVNDQPRTYFARHENPTPAPEDDVLEAARQFEELVLHSGYFANLATYVALCKIHQELHAHIPEFDVLPEGPHPYLLNNPGREPDAVILLAQERVPVEVYNGTDYLGTNTRKFDQLKDLSTDPGGGHPTNPMLVNRRSDDNLKETVRKTLNGMVVDTDCIVACEKKRSDVKDALEILNLKQCVEFVPEVVTSDGLTLDGEDYNSLSLTADDVDKVRPPSKLAGDADELPPKFLKRIRGGVQLQYVNSIYREGHERMAEDACFVIQAIYNILLREGGLDRSTALELGWDRAIDRYNRIKNAQQREDPILKEAGKFLNRLQDEHIITRRNNQIHARKATHPQQYLSLAN